MNKIIKHPISRIILGIVVSLGIPMIINKPVLKLLFSSIGLSDTLNGLIRITITSLILMPLTYIWFYKKVEKREIKEWDTKFILKESVFGTFFSIVSISFLVLLCAIFIDVDITYIGFSNLFIPGLLLVVSLALAEEIVFRGILYRIIEESWGMNWALVISGTLFGLIHITNDNITFQSILGIISGGLLLGVLYAYKRRMWLPIFVHFGWNLTQSLFGINVSGTDVFAKNSIFETTMNGPAIITGGKFGIENSIFTIVYIVLVFILFYTLIKKKEN